MQARVGTWLLLVVVAQMLRANAVWPMQTTVGGRLLDLDGTLRVREVIEENRASKHERTLEELRLHVGVALAKWIRFDATAVGTNGGPTLKANRSGVYEWDDVFQDISPAAEFDEAYLSMFLPSVDLRLGIQKVAWGKLDSTQPNDLINPRTYLDPFLEEEADMKIGVPAVQASYYFPEAAAIPPESRLTAVWVPQYVPSRFPLASCDVQGNTSRCDVERWFPPAGVPTPDFFVPPGLITLPDGSPSPGLNVPLAFRVHNVAAPAMRLNNSAVGLRYSALVHDVDLALYYFHGFDIEPGFDLTAKVFGQPDPSPDNPFHVKDLSGATTLSPEFHQIDSWGADFAYAFDRFTVRGEGAFVSGRPFDRDLRNLVTNPELLAGEIKNALAALIQGAGQATVALPPASVIHSAAEWGLGVDYVYEGYLLLLQVNQTDVLHNHVDLLIKDVETRLLANLRKSFLADRLETQLIATHAIESDYTLLRPTLLYRLTDNLNAQVGYLFIAGRSGSLIGEYRRNDEGFVRLEYKL
jgi:hypothetical protein